MPERPGSAGGAWLPPALLCLLGGSTYLLAHAWGRLLPASAPAPWALVVAAVTVGAVAFALALGFALHPAAPPSWWRPAVALLALIAGGAAALTAAGHHLPATGAAILITLFAARTAETVARHLAPALQLPGDYGQGDWSRQGAETRRIVLEVWVVCALAGAVGGGAAAAGLALAGAGGLALAAGARLDALRRAAAAGEIAFAPQDRTAVTRTAALVALAALGLASVLPGLPPLRSRAVYELPLALLRWLLRPTPEKHAAVKHPPRLTLPPLGLPLHIGGGKAASAGVSPLTGWHPRTLAVLALAAILAWVLVEIVLWRPELRRSLARLWRGLRLTGLWRWLRTFWAARLPRSERWSPEPAQPAAASPAFPGGLLAALRDGRLAIRAAYRRYLRAAAAAGHPRDSGETPASYLARLRPVVAPAAGDAANLTAAYEVARFSGRPGEPGALARVRLALAHLLPLLRAGRGRRPGPSP